MPPKKKEEGLKFKVPLKLVDESFEDFSKKV
jgi:hypothetical protein